MSYGTVCPRCREYVRDNTDYAYHLSCHDAKLSEELAKKYKDYVALLTVAKEALEFYGLEANYVEPEWDRDYINKDFGNRAREALAKIEEMEK